MTGPEKLKVIEMDTSDNKRHTRENLTMLILSLFHFI